MNGKAVYWKSKRTRSEKSQNINHGLMSKEVTSKHATPLPPLNSSYRFKSGTTERPRKAHS
jgi:hypothetical protein